MFILCPHCHFLVGVDPRTGAPPALCPKCGGALGSPASADEGRAPTAPEASADEVHSSVGPGTSAAPVPVPPAAEATPAPPSAAPSSRDAEAFIAAMAAKPARRTGGVRRKTSPSPDDIAALQEAAAPPASTRAPRTRRRPTPEPAVPADTSASAPAPAVAQPPGKAAPWWSRLLGAWRARAAKAAAAKAAATAAPPDPLAASVRNRARARRAESSSVAQAPSTVAPTAALVETTPQAVAPVPSADDGHAPAPATPEGAQQVAQEVAREVVREIAPAPGVAVAAAPAVPLAETDAGTPVAETAAPIAPFVERRRNPDLPIPPGTVPTHPLRRRTDAPSFARPQPIVAAVRRDWRWPAAVAALSLLLVLQLLLAQRDSLAADARWRPMVSSLCAVLRCSLPPWREAGAFTMLGRDVRAHPSAPGALLIHASFRNDARWPQPWPQVLLTLSNVDGRVVGARAFAAREYLEADAAQAHELAPGQTAAISLAVVEPAPDIVAFSFDFR